MSKLTELIQAKLQGHPLALPPHLRDWRGTGKPKLHDDWPPLLNRIPRSYNAYGPRCALLDPEGFRIWPPRLVEGFGVARWENSESTSILYIPALENCHVTGKDVYGRMFMATEMNPGNPRFQDSFPIQIPEWRPNSVRDQHHVSPTGLDFWEPIVTPNDYSPSALQKFSKRGFMQLEPYYRSTWNITKKRELPVWPEIGEDRLLPFFRMGYRPDHVDLYYNRSTLIGQIGFKWE